MKWKEHFAGVVSAGCPKVKELKLKLKKFRLGEKWNGKERGFQGEEQRKASNVMR